jgi:hypothetical protein
MESLGHIEGVLARIKRRPKNRLRYLEERIRNLSLPTSISGLMTESNRYNQGLEVDAISKSCDCPKPKWNLSSR